MSLYHAISPLLFLLPPEHIHRLAIRALAQGWVAGKPRVDVPALRVKLGALQFHNPVGLAAGFDKNAEAATALLGQGFGFVECGTVTPQAQQGNPRPRIFRLPQDGAVINRLGFNNHGMEAMQSQLMSQRKPLHTARLQGGVLGINIGRNKESADPLGDYIRLFDGLHEWADYMTVNISSPNTPGLRAMQQVEALEPLLEALFNRRSQLNVTTPLWLKLAPDLDEAQCEAIAALLRQYPLDALVISNTTTARPASLRSKQAHQQGGLSGKPLLLPSTALLRRFYQLLEGHVPLVGVGGVASAADAYAKIRAGASLVQLYTALVYEGFGLIKDINSGLLELLRRDGYSHISQAVGADAR